MTIREIYNSGKKALESCGVESPAFDAMCLVEKVFGITRHDMIVHRNIEANEELRNKFFEYIEKRKRRVPLQYILGKWNFMGMDFHVGEGVLVPREDTEVLVYECADRLKGVEHPKILDLCGGSGAVAIGVASIIQDSEIISLELSDKAYYYLEKNIKENNMINVKAVKGDVFSDSSNKEFFGLDAIISNPPYIPTSDIKTLQKEVQSEPKMALDGGEDGLIFYREIGEKWIRNLKPGGIIAVEVGMGQSEDVAAIFMKNGISDIKIIEDINGIDRVVSGKK